jgi:CubicO group peptidase (beta-lactamase class C family)
MLSLFLFMINSLNAQDIWRPEAIRDVLEDRLEKQGAATAMVAGTLDFSGTHVISVGKLDKDSPRNADGDTVFEIGSISKVFTSLLLADMVQRGEVKLDDPISKYLPASVKTPTRNGKQITLVDLATHRSGLPRLPDNLDPADGKNPYADYTEQGLYEFLSHCKLKRDIGAKYEYSNLGMGLLGHILTLRAGTNYDELLQERLCGPLGLTNTAVLFTPWMKDHLARGHSSTGRPVSNWDFQVLAGCGGIRSTANDLLKLAEACLGLRTTPLSNAIAMSLTARIDTEMPEAQIGLAWHITTRHGAEMTWHNGGTGGYRSYLGLDRAKKKAVLLLANSEADIDDIAQHILEPQYPLKKVKPRRSRPEIALNSNALDQCVGRYELQRAFFFNVRRADNHLQAQLTGQSYLDIYPSSPTEFFYEDIKAEISFATNAAGRITSLTLHQNGIDQIARKIGDEIPKEPAVVKLPLAAMDACTGRFQLQPGVFFNVRRSEDRLQAKLTGQEYFTIYPMSDTEFFYEVVDAQISFKKNAHGEVTALVLHQNGIDQTANKISDKIPGGERSDSVR